MITSLDMAMPDPNSPAGRARGAIIARTMPLIDIFLPSIDSSPMLEKHDQELTLPLVREAAAEILQMGVGMVGIKLGDQGLTADKQSGRGGLWAGLG